VAVALGGDDREQRGAAQRRSVRSVEVADADLAHALEPLRHHFHVRPHDRVAEPPELLDVLLVDDFAELRV
jgi:hypothetical protein